MRKDPSLEHSGCGKECSRWDTEVGELGIWYVLFRAGGGKRICIYRVLITNSEEGSNACSLKYSTALRRSYPNTAKV